MFLTAKVHVISGMIIGALAVMAMKQVCKTRETHKHSPVPAETPQGIVPAAAATMVSVEAITITSSRHRRFLRPSKFSARPNGPSTTTTNDPFSPPFEATVGRTHRG